MLVTLAICFITVIVLGIRFHYTHKPNTKSVLIHFLVPVNESTWEHLKLVYTPMLMLSFLQLLILKNDYFNILEANMWGILVAMIFIPVVYHISFFIIKKSIFWITILIFVLAICSGYLTITAVLANEIVIVGEFLALILLIVLFIFFAVFTFFPPKFFLFNDPVTKEFGHNITK